MPNRSQAPPSVNNLWTSFTNANARVDVRKRRVFGSIVWTYGLFFSARAKKAHCRRGRPRAPGRGKPPYPVRRGASIARRVASRETSGERPRNRDQRRAPRRTHGAHVGEHTAQPRFIQFINRPTHGRGEGERRAQVQRFRDGPRAGRGSTPPRTVAVSVAKPSPYSMPSSYHPRPEPGRSYTTNTHGKGASRGRAGKFSAIREHKREQHREHVRENRTARDRGNRARAA